MYVAYLHVCQKARVKEHKGQGSLRQGGFVRKPEGASDCDFAATPASAGGSSFFSAALSRTRLPRSRQCSTPPTWRVDEEGTSPCQTPVRGKSSLEGRAHHFSRQPFHARCCRVSRQCSTSSLWRVDRYGNFALADAFEREEQRGGPGSSQGRRTRATPASARGSSVALGAFPRQPSCARGCRV